MLTERFKALEQTIEQLPPETQDALADAIEHLLHRPTQPAVALDEEIQTVIERVLAQHGATLQYLRDK